MTYFLGIPQDKEILDCIDSFKYHNAETLVQIKPCDGWLAQQNNDLEFTIVRHLHTVRELLIKYKSVANAKEACSGGWMGMINDFFMEEPRLEYYFSDEFVFWYKMYCYATQPKSSRELMLV